MASSADQRKLLEDFFLLQDRAATLFSGLKDLPEHGSQWETHFARTFEIYTKLWRYQQVHRGILEKPEGYSMQRWEVGEVAARIGELYYHYYLKTSDVNYLHEAFVFFEAVRARGYFRGVAQLKNLQIMAVKLRYFARFIMVSLFLNRFALVRELVVSLSRHVNSYISCKPTDVSEWQTALQEITLFLQAENMLFVPSEDPEQAKVNVGFTVRRTIASSLLPSVDLSGSPSKTGTPVPFQLKTAVLVNNRLKQVKFSELGVDLYRLAMTLEPVVVSKDPTTKVATVKQTEQHVRKFLLYRPTVSEVVMNLSASQQYAAEGEVFLLYISADGVAPVAGSTSKRLAHGGVALRSNRPKAKTTSEETRPDIDAFYPEDLAPLLRHPLFLIVESDNSAAFEDLENPFDQPLLILLSPVAQPSDLPEQSATGSLFTLFLHSPLTAFCFVVARNEMPKAQFSKCSAILDRMNAALNGIDLTEYLPPAVVALAQVPLIRLFMNRFIFCCTVLYLRVDVSATLPAKMQPSSSPKLPKALRFHSLALEAVEQLSHELGVSRLFRRPSDVVGAH